MQFKGENIHLAAQVSLLDNSPEEKIISKNSYKEVGVLGGGGDGGCRT